jgi:hypothetical protein|tara:strand:+ start:303 stop:479 length:177 start_codon:yes stop_codon:yes gene_type:complete
MAQRTEKHFVRAFFLRGGTIQRRERISARFLHIVAVVVFNIEPIDVVATKTPRSNAIA